jgi:hypothetical protein
LFDLSEDLGDDLGDECALLGVEVETIEDPLHRPGEERALLLGECHLPFRDARCDCGRGHFHEVRAFSLVQVNPHGRAGGAVLGALRECRLVEFADELVEPGDVPGGAVDFFEERLGGVDGAGQAVRSDGLTGHLGARCGLVVLRAAAVEFAAADAGVVGAPSGGAVAEFAAGLAAFPVAVVFVAGGVTICGVGCRGHGVALSPGR